MTAPSFTRLAFAVSLALGPFVGACSLGQGEGSVSSDALFAHECWGAIDPSGNVRGDVYDLKPDFFAAIPYYKNKQLIRVQRGNDIEEVSDGILVLIDDSTKIRDAIAGMHTLDAGLGDAGDAGDLDAGDAGDAGDLDAGVSAPPSCKARDADAGDGGDGGIAPLAPNTFQVAIPAGVTPPGSPAVPPPDLLADPPIVHLAFFLHRSCHNQNTVLYAVSGTMTFNSLFSGDPNESQGSQKLTEASFDVQVGDLRDVPLGHYAREIPCELQSNLKGHFRFYFERGQPGQPFP
ncbi:MAG: hypothetical protein U0359_00305 [Byssovorax sp.]